MMKRIKILIIVTMLSGNCFVFAQTQAQPGGADTKPLELPNFIIEGREQLNVQSGIKQFPEKVSVLSKSQLDSLNSLEKQQSLLLPQKQLPGQILSYSRMDGFLKGQFGRYTTPAFEAGYNFNVKGYNLFANGGLEHSQGHIKNSDFTDYFIKINANYLADEKYFIFGGSKTTTNLDFSSKNYKLYARDDAPERSTYLFNINLVSDGSYEGFNFMTGAGFKTFMLSQTKAGVVDNGAHGFLKVNRSEEHYSIGGNILADFHAYQGSGVNKIDAFANGQYLMGPVRLRAEGGFQVANNSSSETRSGILIHGGADYFASPSISLRADFSSKLAGRYYMDYIKINPYLNDTSKLDFGNVSEFSAALKYEPNQKFNFNIGASYGVIERMPYFTVAGDSASFTIDYDKAKKLSFDIETFWELSVKDYIIANLGFETLTFSEENEVPFSPALKFSSSYKRNWSKNFGSELGILYIGERYSDKENKSTLPAYFDLNFAASYRFMKSFTAFVALNNILNNDVYVWSGYKERNLFFNIGLMWQF